VRQPTNRNVSINAKTRPAHRGEQTRSSRARRRSSASATPVAAAPSLTTPPDGDEPLPDFPVEVVTVGRVGVRARAYGEEKLRRSAVRVPEPVFGGRVKLTQQARRSARPAIAEVALDVEGQVVRAHVAAPRMFEAIDLAVDRLRQRLHDQHRSAMHPEQRPEAPSRARRRLVRRKTYLDEPMSLDEAVFDIESLDVDFYLFTDEATGNDALLERDSDGSLLLSELGGRPGTLPRGVKATGRSPAEMDVDVALDLLRTSGSSRVFFVDAATGRGAVAYHRYDGNDGLLSPAEA
jgi:ribosome-associated translation inhibitor RaiA